MKKYNLTCLAVVSAILLLSITGKSDNTVTADDGFVSIFNGKNFDGWFIMLRKNDDPELKNKVFAVEDGMVHVFKGVPAGFDSDAEPGDRRTFGAMFTDKKYSNYIFRFEYKWGKKSVNCPQQLNLNDGCFYHVSDAKIWPKAIEYQLQYNHISNKNNTGAVLRGGNNYTVYGAGSESNNFLPPSEGGKAILGRLKGFSPKPIAVDPERALGWNQCEIIVMGKQYAIHKLNGEVVNVITDISVGEGRIGLQAEFAEIYYRNMEIKEFKEPQAMKTFIKF